MENLVYLMMAYAVFWLLSFALIFSISNRQKKLDSELLMLKQLLEDDSSNF